MDNINQINSITTSRLDLRTKLNTELSKTQGNFSEVGLDLANKLNKNAITQGTDITITGDGSTENPYIITNTGPKELNELTDVNIIERDSGKILEFNDEGILASKPRDYHGIETMGDISWDQTNGKRELTIAGPITYWHQGRKFHSDTAITCNMLEYYPGGLTENNLYYISFEDNTGTLVASQLMNLKTKCPTCMVYWNGSNAAVTYEGHNHTRNIEWHINAHRTIGTRYFNGLDKISPTTANPSQLSISMGIIYDEDIMHILGSAEEPNTIARMWYQTSDGIYTFMDTLSSIPYTGTVGNPTYFNTSTYTFQQLNTNEFASYWVYATNDIGAPIYIIPQHSTEVGNISTARSATVPVLSGITNELAPEWKLIYRFIFRGNGDFVEVEDFRLSSSLPSGYVAAQTASGILFSPTEPNDGYISATNVQEAIEELDYEKASKIIPTSIEGLPSGALWNNNGTLSIVP